MQTLKKIGAVVFVLLALGSAFNVTLFVIIGLLQHFNSLSVWLKTTAMAHATPIVLARSAFLNLVETFVFILIYRALRKSVIKAQRMEARVSSPLPEVPQDKR
jgi:hypothetical protein